MAQILYAFSKAPEGCAPASPLQADPADLRFDRDLTQIAFYRRVFDEARDEANPLLERVKFLSIVGSIVDEFGVTRYAELAAAACRGQSSAPLERVDSELQSLLADARSYLRDVLAPELAREGIHLVDAAELQPRERAEVDASFADTILPLLMPLGFDAARPFPHISSRSTALAVVVRVAGAERLAWLQVPDAIPALVPFHWRRGDGARSRPATLERGFVWLDRVIAERIAAVFPGSEVVEVHPFKVLRDAGGWTSSAGRPHREAAEDALRRREFGDVLRLSVGENMPAWLAELLAGNLGIEPRAIHRTGDFVELSKLAELATMERPDLRFAPLAPRGLVDRQDIFAAIRQGDILLHHPYESFQPVVDWLESAASDPDVLAISTTLYRAGRNSPLLPALLQARRAGKQVRAVVELRARFDERNNLDWGRALEDAGAHVAYGLVGAKVHAKLTLIVRREPGGLRRYVHFSSGNYNPETARIYTDLALFSCRDDLGRDATDLFNVLSGYAAPAAFRTLLVAPLNLRRRLAELIEREIVQARRGQPARVIMKMNALADRPVIEHLYRASQAGVSVDLIVRGICCLRPGVPGLSERIRVRSIVGRFLEHSRAWYFHNGGAPDIYVGSADLMARNLDERIEAMVRLDDPGLKERVHREILLTYLGDNVKARELTAAGQYVPVAFPAGEIGLNGQECLL